jgi:hypothetical protein
MGNGYEVLLTSTCRLLFDFGHALLRHYHESVSTRIWIFATVCEALGEENMAVKKSALGVVLWSGEVMNC